MSREGQRGRGSGDADKGTDRDREPRPERARDRQQGSSGRQGGGSERDKEAGHAGRERRAPEERVQQRKEGSRDSERRDARQRDRKEEDQPSRHRSASRPRSRPRDERGGAAAQSKHARSRRRDDDREGYREEQMQPRGASDSRRDSSLRTRSPTGHHAGSRHRQDEAAERERRGAHRDTGQSDRHGSARRPERRDQRSLSLPRPRPHAKDDRRRDRSVGREGDRRAMRDRDHERRGEHDRGGERSGMRDRQAPLAPHGRDRGRDSPVNAQGSEARTSAHDRGCRAPSSTSRGRTSHILRDGEKRHGRKDDDVGRNASAGACEGLHTSVLSRSGKEEDTAKEAPSAPAYDSSLDFFSPQFDALKALYNFGLQPPNPKVLPLDNISKCRAILPADLPESRAARMAINPKRRRSQAALEALARARARTATVRSRQEAAAAAARPPALQRVAAAVPEGPLSLLRMACNSREHKVRVVTRHRRGVRGVATGFLRGFDKYMNLLLWDTDELYTVRLRLERSKVVGVPVEDIDDTEESPQQGKMKRGKMERSRLVWKQEKRRRHLQQVLLRGSAIVLVSTVPAAEATRLSSQA
ncbi:probable small nuclear ribonucleoprotein Sm D-like protein at C-terminar half [Coccomyxa sp. Obi]|nr:probable small nuclear ribonucleoprotein Sm D-like protein at C-terminar half [Coccomyxa sp. Obi]